MERSQAACQTCVVSLDLRARYPYYSSAVFVFNRRVKKKIGLVRRGFIRAAIVDTFALCAPMCYVLTVGLEPLSAAFPSPNKRQISPVLWLDWLLALFGTAEGGVIVNRRVSNV